MNKPHKWADVIKAAADGKEVQWYSDDKADWVTKPGHDAIAYWYWSGCQEYRIKPEPEYPKTRMEYEDLKEHYYVFGSTTGVLSSWHSDAARNLANAAIRRAIQDGDVVLPGEKE